MMHETDTASAGATDTVDVRQAPHPRRRVTRWSVLALLSMVIGGGLTLGVDQAILQAWAKSGRAFPITRTTTVDLPEGESLIWYESPESVPAANVSMTMTNADGDRVKPQLMTTDMSYSLTFGRKCGRAIWRLHVPQAGVFQFTCFNHNFESDSKVPAEDRVVFLKQPDSLEQVNGLRNFVKVTGASISMTLVIILYILHGWSLRTPRL